MRKRFILMTAGIFLIVTAVFAVSTRYLIRFNFTNIREVGFSNITFVDNGGIELSRRTTTVYGTDKLLWSIAAMGSDFIVGSGDTAELYKISGNSSEKVFSVTNFLLFSDVEVIDGQVWAAAIPNATIFQLDNRFRVSRQIVLSNLYIWDIVPFSGGMYLLTGSPAQVYKINGGNVLLLATVSNQKNLLKGEVNGNDLYFCGDNTLYRWNGTRVEAMASFDTTIADFMIFQGAIYVITASRDSASVSGRANEQNQVVQTRSDNARTEVLDKSVLFRVNFNGTVERLFESSDAKFLSLSKLAGNIIIGTTKDGGYYEISPDLGRRAFTSLGSGKFILMTELNGAVYGVLTDPSRIVRIDREYAREGYLVSPVYDLKNVSKFGAPVVRSEMMPQTEMTIATRSSVAQDSDCWEDWRKVTDTIQSSPGRYFQYRITLRSQGQATPRIADISIPYVELNLPPRVKSITYTWNVGYLNLKWEAEDANRDIMRFDVYLSREGGEWVQLNRLPLDVLSFNLYSQNYPSGNYRVKIVVNDSIANVASEGLTNFLTGETFVIDNDQPAITGFQAVMQGRNARIVFSASDGWTPIQTAEYCVNGGEWIKILPKDNLFDSKSESFETVAPVTVPAFVQVRVTDFAGNSTVNGTFFR